jgi:hypothetical protein
MRGRRGCKLVHGLMTVRWVDLGEDVEDVETLAVEEVEAEEADEVADGAVDVEVEDVVEGIECCSMSLMAIQNYG